MDIIRLILSIIFPPIGLFFNFMMGAENKIQKVSMVISTFLSIAILCLGITACVLVVGSNKQDIDLLKCRSPRYCDPSDGETRTCYYCKDDVCKTPEKITCVNDGNERFNYETVAGDESEE